MSKLGCKRKAVYNKSSKIKQRESETGIKTSEQRKKMITEVTISKFKKQFWMYYITCYENNGDLIKNKCAEYRVQNKDLKQKPGKVQYYSGKSGHKNLSRNRAVG